MEQKLYDIHKISMTIGIFNLLVCGLLIAGYAYNVKIINRIIVTIIREFPHLTVKFFIRLLAPTLKEAERSCVEYDKRRIRNK